MERRTFGSLGYDVSALTLGGGGIGQVWGATTREECVATTREAIEHGINLLDVAPTYGDGEAERVVGEAFGGRLPDGVRVSTKCRVGAPPASEVADLLRSNLIESLARLRLERVDVFIVHNMHVPDTDADRYAGTPLTLFEEAVRPALEGLVAEGLAGAWGITGIGVPDAVIAALRSATPPGAVQCITNLLDSAGAIQRYEGALRPREVIAAAGEPGVAVMGIRAVQAGALTDAIDRDLPEGHGDAADFDRAAPFRDLARDLGESPAALAHRYALSLPGVSTVVLGVKNREELRECVDAEARGPLDAELISRINAAVGRT
ncbi:MAG: aldo/keto reductase [Chloroflexi bacterium]|nr:aldo/keto reductase [Chloroflexota bacterium]